MADDAPREIPEGTVTVLFTDLVDSTRLDQSLGDDAARELGSQVEQMARGVVADVDGRGGMALIAGPAGLGKTRLTRETAAIAERLGMNVLIGHCVDMESPPHQPSIDQLEQAARAA